MNNDILHIVTVIYNYCEYKLRYDLCEKFINKYKNHQGVNLYVVELVYGKQKFKITNKNNKNHLQLRTKDPLWHKENLINIAIKKMLPQNWKYVAWIDCNISFVNNNFVQKTISRLQSYDVVQMFKIINFDEKFDKSTTKHSFFYKKESEWGSINTLNNLKNNNTTISKFSKTLVPLKKKLDLIKSHTKKQSDKNKDPLIDNNEKFESVPGGAFACTRRAYDAIGKIYDSSIVGGGDAIFVSALMNKNKLKDRHVSASFIEDIDNYIENVSKLKATYVDNSAVYYFHGKRSNRQYTKRYSIITNYDPQKDISYDINGVIQLKNTTKGKVIQKGINQMFVDRNEDDK